MRACLRLARNRLDHESRRSGLSTPGLAAAEDALLTARRPVRRDHGEPVGADRVAEISGPPGRDRADDGTVLPDGDETYLPSGAGRTSSPRNARASPGSGRPVMPAISGPIRVYAATSAASL